MSRNYEAVADQWTELFFAATVNGTGHDQTTFDPQRKDLSKNLVYLAHMQGRVPVETMTYSQIRSEQTVISEMQKAVAVYLRPGDSRRDPWGAVEAKILTKRSKDLQQACASEKYAPARQEEKQREAAAQKQRQADHEAAMQAEWDAAEPERKAAAEKYEKEEREADMRAARKAARRAARNAQPRPLPESKQPKPIPAPKTEPPKPEPTTVKPTNTPKPSGGGGMSGP